MKTMLDNLLHLRSVGYYSAPPSARVTPVAIPENIECIEVLTAGKLFFELDGIEREFRRGAVFWHLSGEKTIWKTVPESPYCCVVFSFTVKERIRNAPRVSYWSQPEEAAEFSEKALSLYHAGIQNLPAFTAYTYSTLLWNGIRQETSLPRLSVLQAAVEYIHNHWHEPIDADDIAQNSHLSKPYLFALFREHLKISPHQYILRQRISHAKVMLANSDAAIKEIAIATGFGSIEVFYRQFKKAVTITPQEFRKSTTPYNFRNNRVNGN